MRQTVIEAVSLGVTWLAGTWAWLARPRWTTHETPSTFAARRTRVTQLPNRHAHAVLAGTIAVAASGPTTHTKRSCCPLRAATHAHELISNAPCAIAALAVEDTFLAQALEWLEDSVATRKVHGQRAWEFERELNPRFVATRFSELRQTLGRLSCHEAKSTDVNRALDPGCKAFAGLLLAIPFIVARVTPATLHDTPDGDLVPRRKELLEQQSCWACIIARIENIGGEQGVVGPAVVAGDSMNAVSTRAEGTRD